MKIFSIVSPTFLLLHNLRSAYGYSDGAGTCRSGALSGFAQSGHGGIGMGSLKDGALEVGVGSNILSTSSTLEIVTGIDNTVKLEYTASSGAGFKGFLFRLSSKNEEVDVSDALSIRFGTDAQKLPSTGERNFRSSGSTSACAAYVAGVTHTSSSIKSLVSSITLNVKTATDLELEVTAVRARSTNNWHHSKFELKAVPPPTESPSSQPSVSPTVSPSSQPSDFPTVSPSSEPSVSLSPSSEPSLSMAPSLSMSPSVAPTVKVPVPTPVPTPAVSEKSSDSHLMNGSLATFAGIVTFITFSTSFLF